jgi:ribosomal protein L35
MRRKAYGSHLLTKKTSKRKRTYDRPAEVSANDRPKVKRMIGS